jgi:hypothetical protein
MPLKTFRQLKSAGLMPYSKGHLNRLIEAGKYRPAVKFNGPKSRGHWDDDYARAHIIALEAQAANPPVNDDK